MAIPNQDQFFINEIDLKGDNNFSPVPGLLIYRFDADPVNNLPFHIRTGENSCGNPLERKQFRSIEFHGQGGGTARVRIYIDRRYICDGKVDFSETPTLNRKINLPVTRSTGYTIDIDMACTGKPRAIEISFDPLGES